MASLGITLPTLSLERLQRFLVAVSTRSDLAVVVMMVVAIAVMILPLPTTLIDVLIACNIGMSVMVLMVAVYLDRPIKFSTLPAVILISTLFRLATEVAVTRVVLVDADAGDIVRAFGDFVVSGNVVVGLVTFLIITVVQFIVVTKGSERVAEVAARFTLDALPGKQMSIDSDLRSGEITQEEARRQRRLLGQESQLFGAMDGAMKFVKGDAITGLVVVVINLLGGMVIGCVQHGMPLGQAVQTYSLLTVGDGLVSQIPALLISFAAGTVVTRVATDEPRDLGTEILRQLADEPRALVVATFVFTLLAAVPGFPPLVFLPLAAGTALTCLVLHRRRAAAAQAEMAKAIAAAAIVPERRSVEPPAGPPAEGPIVLVLSPALAGRFDQAGLVEVLGRRQAALVMAYGLELPIIAVRTEPDLAAAQFRIDIDGVPAATGSIPDADMLLVEAAAQLDEAGLVPEERLPAPAWPGAAWVAAPRRALLAEAGIEPLEPRDAIGLCLQRTIGRTLGQFMGIQETQRLLSRAEADYGDLVQEAQRVVPLQAIADVFRWLVEERVALKPMRLILGGLVDAGSREQNRRLLAEHVRIALRRQISHAHAGTGGVLTVLVLEREAEELIRDSSRDGPAGPYVTLPDEAQAKLLDGIRRAQERHPRLALLTSFDIRHLVRALILRNEIDLPVLSYQELSSEISVQPVGSVNCLLRPRPLHLVGEGEPEAAE